MIPSIIVNDWDVLETHIWDQLNSCNNISYWSILSSTRESSCTFYAIVVSYGLSQITIFCSLVRRVHSSPLISNISIYQYLITCCNDLYILRSKRFTFSVTFLLSLIHISRYDIYLLYASHVIYEYLSGRCISTNDYLQF